MRIAALTLLFLVVFATAAQAQHDYGRIWWDAECSPGEPTTISAEIDIGPEFGGRVHEVRLTRATVGQCGRTVLESREFDPLEPGEYIYEFVDPEPADHLAFMYWVTLHDENGESLRVSNFFNVWTLVDMVSCGNALLGHGSLRSRNQGVALQGARSDQDSPILVPCPDSCWSGFYIANRDDQFMEALLDTDVPALLFGELTCTGIYGCYIMIKEAVAHDCLGVTPSETRSWGSLKARF